MEFEPMLTPREKIPSTGKFPQRRNEPATLCTASPNTTNELFRPPFNLMVVGLHDTGPCLTLSLLVLVVKLFKLQNSSLKGLNRKWLNSVFKSKCQR